VTDAVPVVIAVGNPYRRDDGVGPAVLAAIRDQVDPSVRLVESDGEPTQLLDAWAGAPLAVVIDAVLSEPSTPGTVHRTTLDGMGLSASAASSHGMGIPEAVRLAEVLDRAPCELVVYAVEAADIGFGTELSPAVSSAIPAVVRSVLAELRRASGPDSGITPNA
jgi:hydrogenase maturation protease